MPLPLELSRKYALPKLGTVTSLCKSVVFKTGATVTLIQLDEVRSVFCCSVKFMDGTSQETTVLAPDGRIRSEGEKVNGER